MSKFVHESSLPEGPVAEQAFPGLPDSEVIEVPLLLPGWQMSALEDAAHKRGLTAAEMVRHLLRDFFADGGPARPAGPAPVKIG
jgi:hypothetical protein